MHHVKRFVLLAFVAISLDSSKKISDAGFLPISDCPEPYGEQTYPHAESCNAFYLCVNGTLYEEVCENGLLYDGHGAVHHHCNYHWAVKCGDRQADLTPISTEGCEYQFGLHAESETCSTSYIKCIHGEQHKADCDAGLVYDDKTHSCIWPDQHEYCDPSKIVGFECPHKLPARSVAHKFWPFPRFPVPGDCGRLITCVEGHPRLLTCGDGKLFDSETLTCLEPDELPHCAD